MTERLRPRTRARLARTLSRSRWAEYRRTLVLARLHGYEVVPLEVWVARDDTSEAPTLILRHDVDQDPRSALAMAAIESELGLRSTWYFRWRTAHRSVIDELRTHGFAIGLHYETLSRKALAAGERRPVILQEWTTRLRPELRREVEAFSRLHGPIRSIAPHGDSRVPEASNASLMRGEDPSGYGIAFDGNEVMRGRRLGYWLTDRSGAEGGWKDAVDPAALFERAVTPILCLTHPNNWVSGPSLWLDRAMSWVLPEVDCSRGGLFARPIRTGSDAPLL